VEFQKAVDEVLEKTSESRDKYKQAEERAKPVLRKIVSASGLAAQLKEADDLWHKKEKIIVEGRDADALRAAANEYIAKVESIVAAVAGGKKNSKKF